MEPVGELHMQQTTQDRDQKSPGPFAGAGAYDYDLPVARGGVHPAHAPRPARQGQWSWKSSGIILLLNIAANAFHDFSGWPQLESFVVVYGVASLFAYWVGERPRQSFLPWALKLVGIWLNFYIGFVTVPESLRGLLPEPLAFGLPAFFVTLIFYWVPPLKQSSKTYTLWQWLLCAVAIAAFWGWAGPHLVK